MIDEYNKKIEAIQLEQPEILEKYLCLCRLKSIAADEKEKAIQLKRAKELLGIPEHKKRLSILGRKIDEEYILSCLLKDTDRIEILHFSFIGELKRVAEKNGVTANHVTAVSPDKLLGDKLETSKNCLTQFGQKRGDFLFATTLPDRKLLYALRETLSLLKKDGEMKAGMMRIDENTYLFFNDENIEITDSIKLKTPKYVYELDIEKFTPETKFTIDKDGNYKFLFDDEWYCDEPQKVLDEQGQPIVPITQITDVSSLAHDYNLYVVNDARKAFETLDSKNFNSNFKLSDALKYCVKSGYITNINGQMVKHLITNVEKAEEKQETIASLLDDKSNEADTAEEQTVSTEKVM